MTRLLTSSANLEVMCNNLFIAMNCSFESQHTEPLFSTNLQRGILWCLRGARAVGLQFPRAGDELTQGATAVRDSFPFAPLSAAPPSSYAAPMSATPDPLASFKTAQREGWSLFAPLENFTAVPAAHLVRYANVQAGQALLDVGCGTGVVAITAARAGAQVRGLDLTPALLERARVNAAIAEVEVEFTEGDAEALPYPDASFDVVLSQFAHMFAPRAEVTTSELLRVLRPGGTLAFSTWPPDQIVGKVFALIGSYMPAPAPGWTPPPAWGVPDNITRWLGDRVADLHFERDLMLFPALSPQHYRASIEATAGPATKIIGMLAATPDKLAAFRAEIDALAHGYLRDNAVRQHYLLTRARKL